MTTPTAIYKQIQALIAPLNAEERLALIRAIATTPPQSPPDIPESLTHAQYQAKLTQEQTAWYALPAEERKNYRGEYVALHQGQVVDHDLDQRALYIRIRKRYEQTPVPILPADWEQPPTYVIRSPRLEHN